MQTKLLCLVFFIVLATVVLAAQPTTRNTNLFKISSVEVNGESLRYKAGHDLNLGAFPQNIVLNFGVVSNAVRKPLRVQCKLSGVDHNWHEGGGEMNITVRFFDKAGIIVSYQQFVVRGNSAGWSGNLTTSTLTHRRETLTVPAGASRMWVIISSAGPPSATGIYVVDNLIVSRISTDGEKLKTLLQVPFPNGHLLEHGDNQAPPGWVRDGDRPSMAKVVEIGQDPKMESLAIVDDDPMGHAEWHNTMQVAPSVAPNEKIVIEWNEMYSIGESANHTVSYSALAPGTYTLRIAGATIFGELTGRETDFTIYVPLAVWEKPWFWALIAGAIVVAFFSVFRYITRKKLHNATVKLQQQQALELERVRIARDIHDDLGSRVTQISLLSAMAQADPSFSEKARAKFGQISTFSRDLVSALYETVWAVSPENDNLDAMINFLCELVNELCDQAQLKCRLHVSDLPKSVEISSRGRHNISMVVKETMQNIIKHANASQVTVRVAFADPSLTISIHDDGRGFDFANRPSGNGLANMGSRMKEIQGTCSVSSSPQNGTTVYLRINVTHQGNKPALHQVSKADTLTTELENEQNRFCV